MKITKTQLKQIIKEELGSVLSDELDRDEQAQAFNHYSNIKNAVGQKIADMDGDWALEDSMTIDFGEIEIPTGGTDQEHSRFVEQLRNFVEGNYFGKLEDLGVQIEPY